MPTVGGPSGPIGAMFDIIRGAGSKSGPSRTLLSEYDKNALSKVFAQAKRDVASKQMRDLKLQEATRDEVSAIRKLQGDKKTYAKLKADLNTPASIILSAQEGVGLLVNEVNKAIRMLEKFEYDVATDPTITPRTSAQKFDAIISAINGMIGKPNKANLLAASWAEVTYKADENGSIFTVPGKDIRNRYEIKTTTGSVWKADSDTGTTLVEYDATGTQTGREANIDGSFLSKNPNDNGEFISRKVKVFNATETEEIDLEGTIVREGLSLLNSWYYDDMKTKEGRAKALEDLRSTRSGLITEQLRYESVSHAFTSYSEKFDILIDSKENQVRDLLKTKTEKEAQVQLKVAIQEQNHKIMEAQQEANKRMIATLFNVAKKSIRKYVKSPYLDIIA